MKPSGVRPVDQPLAWVGADRILLDDITPYGLRRKVIARRDDLPDVMGFVQAAIGQAQGAEVYWWLAERDRFWFLWIVWKLKRGR